MTVQRFRLVAALLASLFGVFWGGAMAAAQESGAALVIAVHVRPADRPALRSDLVAEQTRRLAAWMRAGVIDGYQLYFSRYADGASWDALEIVTFRNAQQAKRWDATVRAAPGGLDRKAQALLQSIETTPVHRADVGGTRTAADPAVLVVPYLSLVSAEDYAHYLKGYTIPQFEGWIKAGVLDSYDIVTADYPAGRAWNAMIVLRYHNDAALARRDDVKESVRGELAHDPAWKAISDDKKAVRSEGILTLADQLASAVRR